MKKENEKENSHNKNVIDIREKNKDDALRIEAKRISDLNGYTNYSGEASLTRRKLGENDDSDVSLLENESDTCATKSDTLDDFEDKFDDLDIDEPPSEDGYFEDPYGISDEDYVHSRRNYNKETLIYYAEDGVFTDECVTFIDNASLLVGEKWRMEIGKYEENVAYIRNDKIATDYEVIVEDSSFADVKKHDSEEV